MPTLLYLKLRLQAILFRSLTSLVGILDRHLSTPLPAPVAFRRKIPAAVGKTGGSINLLFYTPKSYRSRPWSATNASAGQFKGYPVVINFHGSGFCVSNAKDDARWSAAVVEHGHYLKDAVVVSVEYRLAPEYPFPTAIEDCVSAVLYIWSHAEELGLDAARTAFSGFSAGGNLTYTTAIRLHEELLSQGAAETQAGVSAGKLMALASFYPSVDWTKSRAERDASNPNLISAIPPLMYRFFDSSYLAPKPDMKSPLLSPGLAPDQLLLDALPDNMILITCGGDQLLVEAETLRKRLRELGKRVDGYTVEGAPHAWDKRPTFRKGNESRDKAYELVVRRLQELWGMETA
ncbi:MAG: hypothetical protein M1818_002073 [Claussenomyces sp. TS43310]|nr:MAG: hypothetical protein M1818_002073 [Claussenomyces sp. TS43310]